MMSDAAVVSLVVAAKVAAGEWPRGYKPSRREVSEALRAINRLDVAARIEGGKTILALRD